MAEFELTEYCRATFATTVEIPDETLREVINDCRKEGYDAEETADAVMNYIDDVKWDYTTDREVVDDDTDDWDWDDYNSMREYVDDLIEPTLQVLGSLEEDESNS